MAEFDFNKAVINIKSKTSAYEISEVGYGNSKFEIAKNTFNTVGILPFKKNEAGSIISVVVSEVPNFYETILEYALLTETVEEDDSDDLVTAQRGLFEETTLQILDVNKWYLLGQVKLNKFIDKSITLYAVDITGKNNKLSAAPTGDDMETDQKITEIKINEILKGNIQDSLILSGCFLLYSYFK